jgi:5'-nucleotidase
MRILLTNDDGITAPGMRAMHRALDGLGELTVVAPAKVQSATSHAVTFHRAIEVAWHADEHLAGWAVDGRPADCVKLALTELLEQPPDLVVSGMNAGANIGVNVLYSGTVAAAREAAMVGLPAVAVSLHLRQWDATRWGAGAAQAREAIDGLVGAGLLPGELMNVNVPVTDDGEAPAGTAVVPLCMSPIADAYRRSESDGRTSYEACGGLKFRERSEGTDVAMLMQRYLTITPMHADLTDRVRMEAMRGAGVGSGGVT